MNRLLWLRSTLLLTKLKPETFFAFSGKEKAHCSQFARLRVRKEFFFFTVLLFACCLLVVVDLTCHGHQSMDQDGRAEI